MTQKLITHLFSPWIGVIFFIIPSLYLHAKDEQHSSQSGNNAHHDIQYFEYQDAAQYSHLNWPEIATNKITIQLYHLKNYSGIPLDDKEKKPEYYYYGKLPQIMNTVYQDAFAASRVFELVDNNPDYHIEFILNYYKLPFQYTSDTSAWWKRVQRKVDRQKQQPGNSNVELTMKITAGKKPISTWIKSVSMALSDCDLNRYPQPQTALHNDNSRIKNYLSTTPGQTYLAASNYLILNAIQHLKKRRKLAKIERIVGNQIYLNSESSFFTNGELLSVFYRNNKQEESLLSMGKIQIVNSMQDYAIAYPFNLRSDHLRAGDLVQILDIPEYSKPKSTFVAVKRCASVITAKNSQP